MPAPSPGLANGSAAGAEGGQWETGGGACGQRDGGACGRDRERELGALVATGRHRGSRGHSDGLRVLGDTGVAGRYWEPLGGAGSTGSHGKNWESRGPLGGTGVVRTRESYGLGRAGSIGRYWEELGVTGATGRS